MVSSLTGQDVLYSILMFAGVRSYAIFTASSASLCSSQIRVRS